MIVLLGSKKEGIFKRVKLTRIHQCVIVVLFYMYMYVHYAIWNDEITRITI